MSKHTPGPWTAEFEEISKSAGYGYTIRNGLRDRIADLIMDERDARLIAAAPELLKALKDIASQKMTSECDEQGDIEFGYDTIIKVARAAIAKAEGRT